MCVSFTTNKPATFKIGLQPTLWQFFYWHMRYRWCVSVGKLSQQDLTGIVTENYKYYTKAG